MRKILPAFIAVVIALSVLLYALMFHDMLHRNKDDVGYWFAPQVDITPYELALIIQEICQANSSSGRCGVSQDFADHDPYWEAINRHFIRKDK